MPCFGTEKSASIVSVTSRLASGLMTSWTSKLRMDQPLSAHAGAWPRAQKATNPTRTDRAFDRFTVLSSPSLPLGLTQADWPGLELAGVDLSVPAPAMVLVLVPTLTLPSNSTRGA